MRSRCLCQSVGRELCKLCNSGNSRSSSVEISSLFYRVVLGCLILVTSELYEISEYHSILGSLLFFGGLGSHIASDRCLIGLLPLFRLITCARLALQCSSYGVGHLLETTVTLLLCVGCPQYRVEWGGHGFVPMLDGPVGNLGLCQLWG
uniref:Uncharacterized protein n=1 Tax=Physcomitrium patens TaxID=3218 RepID=A0A7I4E5C5_PHYPA|nr:uncharacterized protein LOC112285205 isoform X2 [Physcomitrium patens]|eukprot:XP_024381630.1 uncharacterized protein LOC112285205 isoform X2 [Physcomitrella patens]